MGRRLGGERKGSCGRDRGVRVFWVKSRRELGGRNGLRKSILRIGSRGRIVDCCWVLMEPMPLRLAPVDICMQA
jgi:hypothetical protein